MKKTILAISFLLISVTYINAQRGENPMHDPAYNPYEKILDDTARGKRTARFLKYLLPPDLLKDKFYTSPCNDYAILADTRIEQFNAFVSKFQSLPSDPKQMKIAEDNYKKNGCKSIIEKLSYEIEYLEKQGSHTSDAKEPVENLLCRTKGSVQLLKNNLAYLEALKKLFPGTPGLEDAAKIAHDGITKYGNNKSLLASIKSNKNEALAEVVMPKAVTQNAEWEAWFKSWFTQNYPGHVLVRQSLLSANWFVKKNEISGFPEYRQIGTAIGAKGPDGKCRIIKVDIFQYYTGGRFENSTFKLADKNEMLCENLK